jgi:hypothetical protein
MILLHKRRMRMPMWLLVARKKFLQDNFGKSTIQHLQMFLQSMQCKLNLNLLQLWWMTIQGTIDRLQIHYSRQMIQESMIGNWPIQFLNIMMQLGMQCMWRKKSLHSKQSRFLLDSFCHRDEPANENVPGGQIAQFVFPFEDTVPAWHI